MLRWNLLFVASGTNRVTAFAVTDDPDQPPLTRIAQQNIVGSRTRSAYLEATTSDQLWYAGNGLYRLDLSSGALSVVSSVAADSVAAHPLQRSGDILFLGRNQLYTRSVLLSPFQIDNLASNWGTTVGSKILAVASDETASGFLNEDGQFFRVQQSELPTGDGTQFDQSSTIVLPLPNGLDSPLLASAITNRRIAAAVGGVEPTCWVLDIGGQIVETHRLSESPDLAPIPMGDGFVLAMPNGRLQYLSINANAKSVDDYKPKIETDQDNQAEEPVAATWIHAASVSDELLLAVDTNTKLTQVQLRAQPSPHLYGIRTVQLDSPVAVPFVLQDGFLAVATIDNRVHIMDAQTLQPIKEIELPGPVTSELWSAKGWIFCETDAETLHAISLTESPKIVWSRPGDASGVDNRVAGTPRLIDDQLLITRRSGAFSIVDMSDGQVKKTVSLHETLDSGPIQIDNELFVQTVDGGLVPLSKLVADE